MKYILSILIILSSLTAIGQGTPTYQGNSTSITYNRGTVGALRMQLLPRGFYPFPTFDTLGTIWVDSANTRGLYYHNGISRIRMASIPYVDSVALSIEAGSVDSSIYSTVTRLADSLHGLRDYVDSNNTIIYGSLATLFDTLPNYVDTAQLNDSLQVVKALINLKQNYSDTTTFDATRYYVDTGNASIRANYVPYTGATTDVNIGTHNLLTNSLRLSTSPTGTLTNVGQLYWDATNVAPSVPLNANVNLQMGQEMYIRAVNKTGVQINDGQVVYVNDAQGNNPTIALANSDSVNTSIVVGVATENIAINGTGFVTTFGIVNGFNTSTFNDGDALYLNTVSGQLSNTIPSPPHNVVKVAIALNSTINGKIFVQPSEPLGQDTTFAAPYNSDRVAPTQRSIGTYTRKIVQDTASALRTAINAKYGTSDTGRAATNIVTGGGLNKVRDSLGGIIATKGSGTVTSVATGFGATGGTITTTGTISVDSIGIATRARVQKAIDSLNVVKGNGTVTSIQLVGGTNVTITPTTAITTSGVYTISATGGGSAVSATSPRILYKSGSDTLKGATRVLIDSTDGRLVLANNTDTSSVSAYFGGGTKFVGRNRMGMSSLVLVDTVSIPAALQRAINAQVTSTVVAGEAIRYTNNFIFGGMMSSVGTYSFAAAAYNATIQQFNYNRGIYPAASGGANVTAMLRVASASQSSGIVCGNNAFSGGGGRGTFMFSLPTFAIGERIFFGYSSVVAGATTTDPSTFLNSSPTLGVGKDAADGELFFMYGSGVTGLQKVSTGVVPNNEDVYRVTVYISPKSGYYIQLEVLSKSGTTVRVINPTTNIPPIGNRLVQVNYVNTAATGVAVSFGIIQNTEEIY